MSVARTLSELLTRSAAAHGDRVAVVDGVRSLRYGELDAAANRLARVLFDCGVAPGDRVGLLLDKSLEAVVGIHGVLRAGAAYVPLDPQAPPLRQAYIVRDAGVEVLLSSLAKASVWPQLCDAGVPLEAVVALDAGGEPELAGLGCGGVRLLSAADVERQPADSPEAPIGPLDLAYILYTSGSTGDPKGVALTHRNALGFVDWAAAAYAIGPSDRLSSHAPLHFDLSIFDLFAAAHGGAAVVLVPPGVSSFPVALSRFIEEAELTVWYSVPSVLSMLLERGSLKAGAWPRLRSVLFAGEVFPTKYLYALMDLVPHAEFHNLYGPTETNVCTAFAVPRSPAERPESLPIGRPITGVDAFVVTDDGALAAPDAVGELYVRGPTVTPGYWGDRAKSDRVLLRDRFGASAEDPVYRTGDLAHRDGDGILWLVGRRDAQIKSRGYRIELGDIESALYRHDAVLECAVKAVPDDIVTNRIEAYVVARGALDVGALAGFCRQRLPPYMVPERFHVRDELPRTSTGKVDRRRL